ncbi:Uncharacterised protein [uncultured archaeon]|nr:Uncharacterised protein [uncultured archaeon]
MTKEISCRAAGVDCDFMVRSENEEELVSVAQQHVKNIHHGKISKADVLKTAMEV